ncbi:MAG: AMP-binding protein [Desulfurococcaceae archaeon]
MKNIKEVYNEFLRELYTEEEVIPPGLKWKAISIDEYKKLHEESVKDLFKFWLIEAVKIRWEKPWVKIYEGAPPNGKWFIDGALDPYFNIIEKHKNTWVWNKIALIWEGEDGDSRAVTYSQLDSLVNKIAYGLINNGIKRGEWIVIYAPPLIETIAITLAAIKIGLPFEHVFTGFGYYELARRIANRRAKVIFTVDGYYRRGKLLDTLGTVRRSREYLGYDEKTVIISRVGSPSTRENEILLDDLTSVYKSVENTILPSDHPFQGLHPGYRDNYKPITHPVGGYLVQVHATSNWIGIRPRDTYFCTVWPGWITFSSYVATGPLMIGSTILLYDGGPDYPSWERWWSIIEDYGVTLLLTTGTALRLLSRNSGEKARLFNMDTLRSILVTAEPLDTNTWWWVYRVVGTGQTPIIDSDPNKLTGRIPVVNLYIQSEIGSFVSGNLINYTFPPIKPGSAGPLLPGFNVKVLVGNNLLDTGFGEIVVNNPWPAMPIEYPEDYIDSWRDDIYRTRDYGYLSSEKYLYVIGRLDNVYKSSGFRLSSGAVREILSRELGITQIGIIKCLDRDRFENIVTIYNSELDDNLLKRFIRDKLGPIHEPRVFIKIKKDIHDCLLNNEKSVMIENCSEEALYKIITNMCK